MYSWVEELASEIDAIWFWLASLAGYYLPSGMSVVFMTLRLSLLLVCAASPHELMMPLEISSRCGHFMHLVSAVLEVWILQKRQRVWRGKVIVGGRNVHPRPAHKKSPEIQRWFLHSLLEPICKDMRDCRTLIDH